MLKLTLLLICMQSAVISFSQTPPVPNAKDTANTALTYVKAWEKDFFDEGLALGKDSLHINDEVKKLMTDAAYRDSTYPAKYTWPVAIGLMKKMDLKKAFWHIMNLYRTDTAHKVLVLQTFVMYDSIVDMQTTLRNSFYTYAMTDPQVCVFKNGKPVINHPDVLEIKFRDLKEITAFIVNYRSRRQKAMR